MKTTKIGENVTSLWLVIAFPVICFKHFALHVNADPVTPCIKHGSDISSATLTSRSLFVADTVNRCAFYWCIAGRWLQAEPFVCPGGTAVKRGYVGTANPCATDAPDVSLCQAKRRSTSATATHLLPTGSNIQHVHRLPSDHHPAMLTWNVIDLTEEQHQSQHQQQQDVKSAPPRQSLQYLKNINMGHRHFVAKAYVKRNARIRGGEPVKFVRSLQHCWKVCLSLVECSGFDFIASREALTGDAQCFLHGQQTICNRHEHLPGSDSYRLHMCDWSNHTSTSTSTTTPNNAGLMPHFVESIPRRHVAGGHLLPSVRSATACVAHCVHQRRRRRSDRVGRGGRRDGRCVAVDFDTANDTCWLHSPKTGCASDNMLLPLNTSTHYLVRRHDCNNLKGYVIPGVHSLGGAYQPQVDDVMTCYRACASSSNCAAIDFDSIDNSCWFHGGPSTCSRVKAAPSTLQIRRRRDCS